MAQPLYSPSYAFPEADSSQVVDLCKVGDQCPAADRHCWQALQLLLDDANRQYADEVHIEPDQDCWRLRMRSPFEFTESRVQGTDKYKQSMELLQSHLWNSPERQTARRCWFHFTVCDVPRLVQLDVVPTSRGDTYMIRLLHELTAPPARLDQLSLSAKQRSLLRSLINLNSGLVLLSSDIRDARTQTARAIAQELVAPDKKIVCAESPCHPLLPRTTQLSMDLPATAEQTSAWIAACQMVPNAIVACQTLEDDTARQLVRFASESTVVLQSVDAVDAANAVDRLLSMGIRSEAIARSLSAIVIQRRARSVCAHCKVQQTPDDAGNTWLAYNSPIVEGNIKDWLNHRISSNFSQGNGCSQCRNSGCGSPMDIFDIITLSDEIKDALYDGDVRYALYLLRQNSSLENRLLKLAREGNISLTEAMRIAPIQLINDAD